MITFKKLSWSNCFSYGEENSINLNEDTITQILGFNGCLTGHSVIFEDNGRPHFISSLVHHKPKDFYTLGVDEHLNPIRTKVTDFIASGTKEVFKVQLDSGDTLNLTGNHLLRTFNGWKPLAKLKEGDFILDARNRAQSPIPTSVDETYWLLLAYLNTEGGMSDIQKRITFTNKDLSVSNHFQELLHSFDPRIKLTCTDKARYFNYYLTFDRSSKLKQDFINYITKDNSVVGYYTEKSFPAEFINLPDSLLDKIMGIYIDTDGCLASAKPHIYFSTSSKRQAQQILYVLRHRYNLLVSIRTKKTYRADNYEISITRLDYIKQFLSRIGKYIISYKKDLVVKYLSMESKSTSYTQDLVPKELLLNDNTVHLPVPKDKARREPVHYAYSSLKATKCGITRDNYSLLVKNGTVNTLKDFDNTKFLRIKKIDSLGEMSTYDLTTDSSNFFADNILVHNSGKSSIALILEEVLYNKNSKGIKKADIPNRNSDGTYSITLDFDVDDAQYKIDLVRNKTLKIKLFKDNVDISSHTALNTFKTIESLIGVDFKTFSQLVYQNTSSSLQFLTATDTTRKKFLIDLLGLEKYVEHHNEFKNKAKDISNEVAVIEAKVETIKSWLDNNNLDGLQERELIPNNIDTSEDEMILAKLKLDKQNIKNTNKKIQSNNNKKARLASKEIQEVINLPKESPIDLTELNTKLGGYRSEQRNIKAILDKMKNLQGKCPTCNQEISSEFKDAFIEEQKALFRELKDKAQELNTKIKEATDFNTHLLAKNKLIQEFETLYRSIDNDLPKETLVEDDLDSRITELSKRLQVAKDKADSIIKENLKIEKANTKIKIYTEQAVKYKEQLEVQTKELAKTQKLLSHLEVLKKSFSTNGLLAYKIEVLVKELEQLTNVYLADLSDGRFTI